MTAEAYARDFASLLSGFDEHELRSYPDPVVGLWPDFTLAYVNPAWARFAQANGAPHLVRAWQLGCCVLDAMVEPVRSLHRTQYERCLSKMEPWHHDYECSSPETYRVYRMTVYPLLRGEGLLVVHSLHEHAPHDPDARPPTAPDRDRFAGEGGLITQCAYCRRVREAGARRRWLWVPDWVRQAPEDVTHGVCPACAEFYFRPWRRKRRARRPPR